MSNAGCNISIVLPTYNEAGNILPLIDSIQIALASGFSYEILVLDDNSPDGTYEVARQRAEQDPRVRAILRTTDRGFAKSIRDGIERANGARIIVMDSDLTHNPADIPRLLHVGEIFDIVSGSRFCAGGRMVDTFHYIASMVFNWSLRAMIGTQVQDNLGGYFTVHRNVVLKLPLDEIFYGYGEYYFRLLHFAQQAGCSIVEIPSSYLLRGTGKSKSNWMRMIRTYSLSAIKLRISIARSNRNRKNAV